MSRFFSAVLVVLLVALAIPAVANSEKWNPDKLHFEPSLDVALAFPIAVTGFHYPFSGSATHRKLCLDFLGAGTHLFRSNDELLLVGGISLHGFVLPSDEWNGWIVIQISPVAFRIKSHLFGKGDGWSLYAGPAFSRVFEDARGRGFNTVGLQFFVSTAGNK